MLGPSFTPWVSNADYVLMVLKMECYALIRLCCCPFLHYFACTATSVVTLLQQPLAHCDIPSAAEEASRRLASVGFQKLSEKQEWKLQPGGRYYFTRNLSTIVAFAVGAKYQPGNGLHMIGAHTDR